MPIYEYRCDACNTVFEEWHRHADDVAEVPCPECHTMAHRLISNTSFVLKGGGWYVTEYGNRKEGTSPGTSAGAPAGTDGGGVAPSTPETKISAPAAAPAGTPPPAPAAKKEPVAAAS